MINSVIGQAKPNCQIPLKQSPFKEIDGNRREGDAPPTEVPLEASIPPPSSKHIVYGYGRCSSPYRLAKSLSISVFNSLSVFIASSLPNRSM